MSEMQWETVSQCDLDYLEDGNVVSFLFKGKSMPENYEYDGGLFLQPQKWFSIGKSLEYLKKQGATHFMVYDLPIGENE